MKLKYYLRGIGTGILVTTVILMIAFAVRGEQSLTDDEIRERAAELGMVMPEELPASDKLSDTEPSEQSGEETEASDDSQAESQSTQDPVAEDAQADADDEEHADAQSDSAALDNNEKEDKTQPEVIRQAEITIVGGEYSDDVCKKLKKAGIIEDADDFNKYLAEGGYDNLIQPGNYVIPLDADYDEIIKLITEKKR